MIERLEGITFPIDKIQTQETKDIKLSYYNRIQLQ